MRLRCLFCGKSVSTEVPEDTVVRAVLTCPECVEKEQNELNGLIRDLKFQWEGTQRPPEKNMTTTGLRDAIKRLVDLL